MSLNYLNLVLVILAALFLAAPALGVGHPAHKPHTECNPNFVALSVSQTSRKLTAFPKVVIPNITPNTYRLPKTNTYRPPKTPVSRYLTPRPPRTPVPRYPTSRPNPRVPVRPRHPSAPPRVQVRPRYPSAPSPQVQVRPIYASAPTPRGFP